MTNLVKWFQESRIHDAYLCGCFKYQQRNSYTGANPKPILNANELRGIHADDLTTGDRASIAKRNSKHSDHIPCGDFSMKKGQARSIVPINPRNDKIFVLDDGPKRSPNN
ncbi:hypothetical protein V1478_002491 [Vespula squamosa]|uniref:Uncharacterized protein n=1 Tax=Vespula squamosa TaxID=30214 RepID=A0ABD2BSQ4_VESSQ